MNEKTKLSKIPPLLFGRVTRIIFGLFTLFLVYYLGLTGLGLVGFIGLLFLGLSFLIGGLLSNPGCELSALLNLFLPAQKRFHFP